MEPSTYNQRKAENLHLTTKRKLGSMKQFKGNMQAARYFRCRLVQIFPSLGLYGVAAKSAVYLILLFYCLIFVLILLPSLFYIVTILILYCYYPLFILFSSLFFISVAMAIIYIVIDLL